MLRRPLHVLALLLWSCSVLAQSPAGSAAIRATITLTDGQSIEIETPAFVYEWTYVSEAQYVNRTSYEKRSGSLLYADAGGGTERTRTVAAEAIGKMLFTYRKNDDGTITYSWPRVEILLTDGRRISLADDQILLRSTSSSFLDTLDGYHPARGPARIERLELEGIRRANGGEAPLRIRLLNMFGEVPTASTSPKVIVFGRADLGASGQTTATKAAKITGMLVEKGSDKPITGMWLHLLKYEGKDKEGKDVISLFILNGRFPRAKSDSSGRFSFADVPAGRYIIKSGAENSFAPTDAAATTL